VFGCDDEANTTAQLMLILSGSGPVIVLVALHALEGERMQMVNRAAHLQWLLIAGPQPRPRQETYSCLPQAQPGSPPLPVPPGAHTLPYVFLPTSTPLQLSLIAPARISLALAVCSFTNTAQQRKHQQ
jgi:hypothetical protein